MRKAPQYFWPKLPNDLARLKISTRAYSGLKSAEYQSIAEYEANSGWKFLREPGVGVKTRDEIDMAIEQLRDAEQMDEFFALCA